MFLKSIIDNKSNFSEMISEEKLSPKFYK